MSAHSSGWRETTNWRNQRLCVEIYSGAIMYVSRLSIFLTLMWTFRNNDGDVMWCDVRRKRVCCINHKLDCVCSVHSRIRIAVHIEGTFILGITVNWDKYQVISEEIDEVEHKTASGQKVELHNYVNTCHLLLGRKSKWGRIVENWIIIHKFKHEQINIGLERDMWADHELILCCSSKVCQNTTDSETERKTFLEIWWKYFCCVFCVRSFVRSHNGNAVEISKQPHFLSM